MCASFERNERILHRSQPTKLNKNDLLFYARIAMVICLYTLCCCVHVRCGITFTAYSVYSFDANHFDDLYFIFSNVGLVSSAEQETDRYRGNLQYWQNNVVLLPKYRVSFSQNLPGEWNRCSCSLPYDFPWVRRNAFLCKHKLETFSLSTWNNYFINLYW